MCCKRFPLFKGASLVPNIEVDIYILKFTSKDTSEDQKLCPLGKRPVQTPLLHRLVLIEEKIQNWPTWRLILVPVSRSAIMKKCEWTPKVWLEWPQSVLDPQMIDQKFGDCPWFVISTSLTNWVDFYLTVCVRFRRICWKYEKTGAFCFARPLKIG